jgi:hypothetical protein
VNFISLALAIMLLMQTANAESIIEFNKTESPEFSETIYSATGDSCGIEWLVKHFNESSGFGISERSKCKLSLDRQAPYRALLLHNLMLDTNNLQGLRNFFWGRLHRGDTNDEYALRLTRAVAKSKHWSGTKGEVVEYSQGVNRFIMEILNQDKIFSELIETFSKLGFELKVNGVENVLISETLSGETGLFPNGKFPVDCTVSFDVLRKKSMGSM